MDGISLPCVSVCLPDPEDTTVLPPDLPTVDKCQVDVNGAMEWRECVPIARIDSLRMLIADRRVAQGKILAEFLVKMDDAIKKIDAIKERFDKHKNDRD